MVKQAIDWDTLFMNMCYLIALKSKDRSTKVGAVIVDKKNRIVSLGYNGFPREVDDDMDSRHERPNKYFFTEHAERNAIFNSRENLDGCKIYVNMYPCADCARAIIQMGISEVIINDKFANIMNVKWSDSGIASLEMLKEAGISIRHISIDAINLDGFCNGEVVNL